MSIFRKAAQAVTQTVMRFASQASWSLLLLARNSFDYARNVDPRANSAVIACLNWICRTFPEAPVLVLEKAADGTETELVDHPLTALLATPNPRYSGELLWRATLADWTADGNAYWRKIRNYAGTPVQLWWIPQSLMEPVWNENDPTVFIDHYDYFVGGTVDHIPPEDVVHFRNGLDPLNTRKGQSDLKALLKEVFTDEEAGSFSASLLRNLGIPGVIISPGSDEGHISQDDANAIKADVKQKFSGEHRGEPMILPSKAQVQVLSFNPQQMDLKTLRRLPEERVSAVIGVPAIVAGLGAGLDRSTFANMSEAREMAYESNIIPNQRLIAAELRAQLLPDFGDIRRLRVAFDLRNVRVLQEDQNKLWIRVDTAVRGGWLKVARAKQIVGEKPEAGDDIYLRSTAVIETGPDAPEPEPVPAALAPFAGQNNPPADGQPAADQQSPADQPSPEDQLPAAGKAAAGPPSGDLAFERKAGRANSRLIRRLQREGKRLAEKMSQDLDATFEDLGASIRVRVRQKGQKAAEDPAFEIISDTLEGGEIVDVEIPKNVTTAFKTVYESNFERILETTAGTIEQHLGVPVGVNLEDPRARKLIREWATRKGLADVKQQTREAVMQGLSDGRAAGDGSYALGKRIRGMVEGRHMYPGVYQEAYDRAIERGWGEEAASRAGDRAARQYRAESIARSETKTAQNQSSVEAYENSDVVDGLIVYDGTDFDDECRAANGQEWTFEQGRANPIQHPKCVRSFAPKVRKTVE